MILHASPGPLAAGACVGLAVLMVVAGVAAADTHAWTSESDFVAGTLTDVNATASPGNLVLQLNSTAFTPYSGNPIFYPNGSGWDSTYAIVTTVLQISGQYVMWYTGANSTSTGIGRAVSTDGIHWTRNPTTPLLDNAGWPVVLYESGAYKMWYEHGGAYQPNYVYYATSTDGIHWTPYSGNPVLSPSASGFDSFIVFPGGVIHDTSGYRMWYGGNDGSSLTYATGLATSTDGISWTKYAGNPVISPPFGGWWDSERVLPACVLPWDGVLLMGYVGADSSFTQRIALATSSDGIHWTPYPAPTIDIGPAGSWDSVTLSRLSILPVAGNLTMWYGGSPSFGVWDTGVAYAPAYPALGSFDSAVFDSGANGTMWSSLSATVTTPPGTQVLLAARSGNVAVPDTTWSPWYTVGSPGGSLSIPRTRYAQVGARLISTNGTATPTLSDVTLTYAPDQASAPTADFPTNGAWTANASGTFLWTFADPNPGDFQSGYQLQVSSDSGFATVASDTGVVVGAGGQATALLPASDGTWYWRVRTQDNWGLWGPYSAAAMFRVDRTPPTVSATWGSPSVVLDGSEYITSRTPITLDASDGAGIGTALVAYSIDNSLPSLYSVPFRANTSDGQHYLRFTAVDLLGNTLAPQTLPFFVDNTGPSTSIGFSASGSGIQVTVNSTDSGVGVQSVYISIDGAPWSAYHGPITVEDAGNHEVRAYAIDLLGNQGAIQTDTFVIPNVQPYLAGAIGVAGLVFGILLFRRGRAMARGSATLSALLGAAELSVAIASAGTGLLGIPPWPAVGLVVDAIFAAGIAVFLTLAWRGRAGDQQAAPPPREGGDESPPPHPP